MTRPLSVVLGPAVMLVLLPLASRADEAASERARIAHDRQAVEARFRAEQAGCAEKFAVNACLDEARTRRRDALMPLREQELILADRERKQRAAARARTIERNRIEAEGRVANPPAIASAVRARPGPAIAPASGPERMFAPAMQPRADKAGTRAEAAARRNAEAQAERERIRERIEKRAAEGRAVKPLPVPDSKP